MRYAALDGLMEPPVRLLFRFALIGIETLVEGFAVLGHIEQKLRRLELCAIFLLQILASWTNFFAPIPSI